MFQEEDTRIFLKLIDAYHKYFCLFHGSITRLFDEHEKKDPVNGPAVFEQILIDFTQNFNKYFFVREYSRNLMWNLCFPGFFYCPIDRKTFL